MTYNLKVTNAVAQRRDGIGIWRDIFRRIGAIYSATKAIGKVNNNGIFELIEAIMTEKISFNNSARTKSDF